MSFALYILGFLILTAIHEYIGQTSPVYARVMVQRIWERAGKVLPFPEAGRTVPEVGADVREVLEAPYRIIYRAGRERVEILAIIHERRGPDALHDVSPRRAT